MATQLENFESLLERDYESVVNTLDSSGLRQQESVSIPTYAAIRESIGEHEEKFLVRRHGEMINDRLIIAPYIGSTSVDHVLEVAGMPVREEPHTEGRLARSAVIHNDSESISGWNVGIMLNDLRTSKGKELPIPGLLHTRKSFLEQRLIAQGESSAFHTVGLSVEPISLAQLMVARMSGQACTRGTTRLVQLPVTKLHQPNPQKLSRVRGALFAGSAYRLGGPEVTGQEVRVDTDALYRKDPTAGVRRVLKLSPATGSK